MKIKRLGIMASLGLLAGSLFFGTAEGAIVTECVPMLTYANNTVPTYDKPGGSQKGFISPNVSLIRITKIRPDGWAYGSYPIAGGKRIYRWFRMMDVQGFADFPNYTLHLNGAQTVYRATSGNSKTGKLLAGMEAIVVGEIGNNLKVIYRVNGGNEYKMGWIERSTAVEPEPANDYYEDDGSDDGYNDGYGNGDFWNGLATFKGNVNIVYGDVHNSGTIDASTKDSSIQDSSYHDSSKHTTNIKQDSSYHDYSKNTNINIEDNSQTTIDQSQNMVNTNMTASEDRRGRNAPNRQGGDNSRRLNGDVNGDKKVNAADIVIVTSALRSGETASKKYNLQNADMNGDGKLDNNDVFQLIEKVRNSRHPVGDVNNDGVVNKTDYDLVVDCYRNKNNRSVNRQDLDLNEDGQFDSNDVSFIETIMLWWDSTKGAK